MLAIEARKIASEVVYNSLPDKIRLAIENAVIEGKFNCEICLEVIDYNTLKELERMKGCFQQLIELGYNPSYYNGSECYVITIFW